VSVRLAAVPTALRVRYSIAASMRLATRDEA
jgi:hypothetical protein